jgi:predicted metallo-beta-lactamase superfamily hydrolase
LVKVKHKGRNVDIFPSPAYQLNHIMHNKSKSMNIGLQGNQMQSVVFVPVFDHETQFCFSLITAQLPLTSNEFYSGAIVSDINMIHFIITEKS